MSTSFQLEPPAYNAAADGGVGLLDETHLD